MNWHKWKLHRRIDWQSPFTVMAIVLLMYALKVAGKLTVGRYAQSPLVTGDGLHNVADIGEALLVMFAIVISQIKSEHFPFGLKKIQNLGQLAVGISLAVMAFSVAGRALSGIAAQFPVIEPTVRDWLPLPEHRPLKFGLKFLPWVAGVMGGSFLLSLLIGHYQVRIGQKTGQELLVADGKETKSDGRIELTAFVGIIGQYAIGAPWLEYPLAMLVSGLMAKTAWEIGWEGFDSLMQKSLGPEVEADCVKAAEAIPGILRIEEIKTFRNGNEAVCLLKALTRQPHAEDDLRHAIKHRIKPVLDRLGLEQSVCQVRFHAPPADRHRWAVTISKGRELAVVTPLMSADYLRVVNVEDGMPVRTDDYPLGRYDRLTLLTMLKEKRVYQVWSSDGQLPEETLAGLIDNGIIWHQALTSSPGSLGV